MGPYADPPGSRAGWSQRESFWHSRRQGRLSSLTGSSTLEDYVILGWQAGVGDHVTIRKGAKAGGRAAITAEVSAGSYVNGNPAMPYMLERRLAVLQPKLPELFRRVSGLEAEIDRLKKASAP